MNTEKKKNDSSSQCCRGSREEVSCCSVGGKIGRVIFYLVIASAVAVAVARTLAK
jgi:hypothetical protein